MPIHFFFLGIILLFSLSAVFIIVKAGPLIVLQPRRLNVEDYRRWTDVLSPADLHLPFEDIILMTRDGVKLVGWFIMPKPPSRGTVIYLHGVGDSRISGLPIAKLFHDQHYGVCLFDSRRHGESEGKFCTYGFHEKIDLVEVITFLQSNHGGGLGKIGIYGASMGAAVALQAAAIDSRISAVAAESSFTDLSAISLDYQKRIIKVGWKFVHSLVLARAERLGRFNADEVSPLKAVERIRVPILFIHGTEDSLIDADCSKVLYQRAREPKELYLIDEAQHNDTWIVGGEEYKEKLLSFFDQWLPPKDSTNN